jgi:hypothetical protein
LRVEWADTSARSVAVPRVVAGGWLLARRCCVVDFQRAESFNVLAQDVHCAGHRDRTDDGAEYGSRARF